MLCIWSAVPKNIRQFDWFALEFQVPGSPPKIKFPARMNKNHEKYRDINYLYVLFYYMQEREFLSQTEDVYSSKLFVSKVL